MVGHPQHHAAGEVRWWVTAVKCDHKRVHKERGSRLSCVSFRWGRRHQKAQLLEHPGQMF